MKIFTACILFILIIGSETHAQFAGGTGTSLDPYQVTTPDQLNLMRNNLDKFFILNNDIEMNVSPYNSGAGWVPVGVQGSGFSGGLDGNGFTIYNLYMDRGTTTDNGLFGYIRFGAVLKNITLVDVDISGGTETAALVGYNDQGTIINCSATGTVSGTNIVGGLIAFNVGSLSSVTDCYASVSISSHTDAGGFVGMNDYDAVITNCSAYGDVHSSNNAGGFVGFNSAGTISNCSGTGSVIAIGTNNGGFVGYNLDSISNCFSRGSISTTANTTTAGGFAGLNQGGSIINCYNTGNITSINTLNGFNQQNISSGSITNCFWDTQSTGRSSSSTGTGKTTAEMKTASTFTDAGWDFSSVWTIDSTINDGYPFLQSALVLPVELVSFNASVLYDKVQLNWQTATEVNNYGFEVQRQVFSQQSSTGSKEFETIGFVKGNGNSSSIKKYSYTDVEINEGRYSYRLKQLDNDGKFEYSQVVEASFPPGGGQGMKPGKFALEQNYPNPFNPSTTIVYTIPERGSIKLTVYNMLGEAVKTLVNENKEPGNYSVEFNAENFSSGIYIYTIEANGFTTSKIMSLLK